MDASTYYSEVAKGDKSVQVGNLYNSKIITIPQKVAKKFAKWKQHLKTYPYRMIQVNMTPKMLETVISIAWYGYALPGIHVPVKLLFELGLEPTNKVTRYSLVTMATLEPLSVRLSLDNNNIWMYKIEIDQVYTIRVAENIQYEYEYIQENRTVISYFTDDSLVEFTTIETPNKYDNEKYCHIELDNQSGEIKITALTAY